MGAYQREGAYTKGALEKLYTSCVKNNSFLAFSQVSSLFLRTLGSSFSLAFPMLILSLPSFVDSQPSVSNKGAGL